MRLRELFENETIYPYQWILDGVAQFTTESGIRVGVSPQGGNVTFATSGGRPNHREFVAIMRTIAEIISEFIDNKQPESLTILPGTTSREKVYSILIGKMRDRHPEYVVNRVSAFGSNGWQLVKKEGIAESYGDLPDEDEFSKPDSSPCDQCGNDALVNVALDLDLYNAVEHLTLAYNPSGFYAPWFCSNKCLSQEYDEYYASVLNDFGDTCGTCDTKIGTIDMKPCWVCKSLVCQNCCDFGKTLGVFCSDKCKTTYGMCKSCLQRSEENDDLCRQCQTRR